MPCRSAAGGRRAHTPRPGPPDRRPEASPEASPEAPRHRPGGEPTAAALVNPRTIRRHRHPPCPGTARRFGEGRRKRGINASAPLSGTPVPHASCSDRGMNSDELRPTVATVSTRTAYPLHPRFRGRNALLPGFRMWHRRLSPARTDALGHVLVVAQEICLTAP